MSHFSINIAEAPLDLNDAYGFIQTPSAGGLSLFVGTVRNHSQGKTVLMLDYEAYKPMAIKQMEAIAKQVADKYFLFRLYAWHRVGRLAPNEAAVIIAVSTAHRAESFAATQDYINKLKECVPIWKKEHYEDGAVWVSAFP